MKQNLTHIATTTLEYLEKMNEETSFIPTTVKLKYEDIPQISESAVVPIVTKIQVWRQDTFNCAEKLLDRGNVAPGKLAILNMCSDAKAGGGFLSGRLAQEEELCRRSNLYLGLTRSSPAEQAKSFYPLQRDTMLYSKDVTVFRADEIEGYEILKPKHHYKVNVISAAAIRQPKTTFCHLTKREIYADSADREIMKEKIQNILRIAYQKGNTGIVLSAFGCGCFANPPRVIACLFREILETGEFANLFEWIVFAILDGKTSGRKTDNCAIFKSVFANFN